MRPKVWGRLSDGSVCRMLTGPVILPEMHLLRALPDLCCSSKGANSVGRNGSQVELRGLRGMTSHGKRFWHRGDGFVGLPPPGGRVLLA